MIKDTEGCLSVPGQKIDVLRHLSIKVRYLDYHNKEQHGRSESYFDHVGRPPIRQAGAQSVCDYFSHDKLKGVDLRVGILHF